MNNLLFKEHIIAKISILNKRKTTYITMNSAKKNVSCFFKQYLERELTFSINYGIALQNSDFFKKAKTIRNDFETKWKSSRKQATSDFIPSVEQVNEDSERITLTRSQRNDFLFLMKNITVEYYLLFMQRYALLHLLSELDNYLNYCFKYLIMKKPSILDRSSVLIKDINKNATYDSIIELAIEDKLYHLFYKNYKEIFKFAKNKGINHKVSKKKLENLIEFKLLRDLYAHSDGIVNKKFLDKTKINKQLPLGKKVSLDTNLIINLRALIREIVLTFDNQFVIHFPETMDTDFDYDRFLKNADIMSKVFQAPPRQI